MGQGSRREEPAALASGTFLVRSTYAVPLGNVLKLPETL